MRALLTQGLRTLGLDESRTEALERFSALLLEKNQVMNLTAITDPTAVAQLHLLDSAALLQFLDLSGKRVVDVGTGAGFPGMPLRILKDDFAHGDLVILDLDDAAAEGFDGAFRRRDLVLGVDALHGDELSADLDERQAQL